MGEYFNDAMRDFEEELPRCEGFVLEEREPKKLLTANKRYCDVVKRTRLHGEDERGRKVRLWVIDFGKHCEVLSGSGCRVSGIGCGL